MASVWWQQLGLVMAGGALGSALRFVIGDALLRRLGEGFPWGTLAVNCLGAFAAGCLLAWLPRGGHGALPRAFLVVGLLGGLTTFSTLMLETLLLAREGRGLLVPAYLCASVASGLALVWLGARLAGGMRG